MALIKELARERILHTALKGVAAVLSREFELDCNMTFTMSETYRQEIVRKAAERQAPLKFPYSFFMIQSLAGVRENTNNYAIRKHGVAINKVGELALSKKAYMFPVKLGLEFHYIDTDPNRLLTMSEALVIFSASGGLKFNINIGDLYTYAVSLEIPIESTITASEEQNGVTPEATDLVASIVMSTELGFFRSVAATNGSPAIIRVTMEDNGSPGATADGATPKTSFIINGPGYEQPE
jgi:hypothetical protein